MTRVTVLTFPGCPSRDATIALVNEVIQELRREVEILEITVEDPADASALRFLGSPTVQVDGVDIEPRRRGESEFGISCRLYGESGVPPRELIRSALLEATG